MLPLFGLPRGDTPLLLAVTTVSELAKLAVVAYCLWRWKKDIDACKQRNAERERESDRLIQALNKDMERLARASGPWPGLNRG